MSLDYSLIGLNSRAWMEYLRIFKEWTLISYKFSFPECSRRRFITRGNNRVFLPGGSEFNKLFIAEGNPEDLLVKSLKTRINL